MGQTAASRMLPPPSKQLPVRLEPLYADGAARTKKAEALNKHLERQHLSLKEYQRQAVKKMTFGDFIPRGVHADISVDAAMSRQ